MSRSVNKWIGVGTIGRDAETKFTPSGASVTKFSLATNYRFKRGDEWVEETDWHNIIAWKKDALAPYLTKGTKVYVEGRYTNRSYQDKDGQTKYVSEVVCDDIVLVGGNNGGQKPPQPVAQSSAFDDDTPF
jgi:single-strand DNA-binding protein